MSSKVFVDSSVIIAALLSETGGSFYLLTHGAGRYQFQFNNYVLDEVMEVLGRKFPDQGNLKTDLLLLLASAHVEILANPLLAAVKKAAVFIEPEDAPILASALTHSQYLVSLDNDFLGEPVVAWAGERNLMIVRPKELAVALRR